MMTKTKLADLQTAALKATTDARAIAEKQDGSPSEWAEQVLADYNAEMQKARDLLEQIKVGKRDLEILDEAKSLAAEIGTPAVDDLDAQGNQPIRERVKSLGLQVVDSQAFKDAMAPFKGGRVSEGARIHTDPVAVKGLFVGGTDTSAGAFVVNEQSGIVESIGRKALTIRDLVSVRRTGSDAVEYVAQTSHTNAAAVVAEATSSAAPTAPATGPNPLVLNANGGYKPEGAWAYERKVANVKTIAEWVPATKRALADVAALEGLINDELRLDIAEAEEAQILNGNGTGENFTGINQWSGVQTQAFSTDLFESVRKGITKARTVGRVNPTAIVVNPTDAEAIDLAKDLNGAYRYGGPQTLGQRTVWSLPVIESENQAAGEALLGDFSKAVIWDREQTTVTVTDSHADFFIRNMVAILAEERLAMAVTRPTAFVKVDIAA
ncbi:HK97 family phage major capsid protein [Rhodococcus sp. OK611]|uniref:phage major capsid protein n=1 Tax=unclassified Rhodococcus (in: high G+C Gram-positive bacteria) TaxID=192944 RepID=UPI000BC8DDB4|nr:MULTISPECIES: phage major capsid protein [unclassified Rhodococcus (in: high G+C Gram-positive bacteria)]PTR42036.1 HK97 family phage major capsid protein [Rhodococcus sp. OK611]SNX91517.1 phage major capsid protein, HK97 family [Rhodococcus sp. OK270]